MKFFPCLLTHCISDQCVVNETLYCSDVNSTPGFWESVSRLGVTNAGTNNPFESNLTGHWTRIERQCYAPSLQATVG